MQIGGLTLAGLRELAEEAGEKRRPGSADAGSAQPSGEEGASQPQAGEQQSEEEPAACTRPSTPQPAEADNRISPGTPEKPGSPAPTGTLTPPLTPPQIPTGPPQVWSALGLFSMHHSLVCLAFPLRLLRPSAPVARMPQGCGWKASMCSLDLFG